MVETTDVAPVKDGSTEKGGLKDAQVYVGDAHSDVSASTGNAWLPYSGESASSYMYRLFTEGHTNFDAVLTVSASQIGQIMLTWPSALYKTGVVSGGIVILLSAGIGLWTMFLMSCMYLEVRLAKARMGSIEQGKPAITKVEGKDPEKRVTQYHDVVGFFAGQYIARFCQVILAASMMGTGVAQVIANASDMYHIDHTFNKREWAMIYCVLLLAVSFVPTFRHLRVINILALTGTAWTSAYIIYECNRVGFKEGHNVVKTPWNPQRFFNGASILLYSLGGHGLAYEMMGAMEQPSNYVSMYSIGWFWNMLLTVPHSYAVNFAFGDRIFKSDNVYGLLPINAGKKISVYLMIVHQIAAFMYALGPVFFYWEKLLRVHESRWYYRLPARLPVVGVVFTIGLAFPFYGTINSLMTSLATPLTSFVVPALLFNYAYRSYAARATVPLRPFKWFAIWDWNLLFAFNYLIGILFFGFWVTSVFYAGKTIHDNVNTFGYFAKCYQCTAPKKAVVKPIVQLLNGTMLNTTAMG